MFLALAVDFAYDFTIKPNSIYFIPKSWKLFKPNGDSVKGENQLKFGKIQLEISGIKAEQNNHIINSFFRCPSLT